MTKLRLWLQIIWSALLTRSNQAFYDRIAPVYDDFFVDHRIHADNIVDRLSRIYPIRERAALVLDLGCGTGILSKALADKGFNVIGLDISFKSLCILHQHNSLLNLIQAEANFLPFSDERFQSVVCLGVWRHFSDPNTVLGEVRRILTKDGTLIVGYFPPAIAGVIHAGHNYRGRLLIWLYQAVIKKLGYIDRADFSLEEETFKATSKRFKQVSSVASGAHWRLLLARYPLDHSTESLY